MLRISHGSLCLWRRFNVGKRWIFNLQGEAVLLILRVSREFELLRFLRLLASVESREWVLWLLASAVLDFILQDSFVVFCRLCTWVAVRQCLCAEVYVIKLCCFGRVCEGFSLGLLLQLNRQRGWACDMLWYGDSGNIRQLHYCMLEGVYVSACCTFGKMLAERSIGGLSISLGSILSYRKVGFVSLRRWFLDESCPTLPFGNFRSSDRRPHLMVASFQDLSLLSIGGLSISLGSIISYRKETTPYGDEDDMCDTSLGVLRNFPTSRCGFDRLVRVVIGDRCWPCKHSSIKAKRDAIADEVVFGDLHEICFRCSLSKILGFGCAEKGLGIGCCTALATSCLSPGENDRSLLRVEVDGLPSWILEAWELVPSFVSLKDIAGGLQLEDRNAAV
ncbi:unnamed protein product [Prunus armeniaca]|uniref:Uncharacterized protein n=1 Tax=Prunus armeniaca TaxID=36596 RepID=A0A6J5TI48_PRUAR|nr:unnamed protein product [Prunus armeniaca]